MGSPEEKPRPGLKLVQKLYNNVHNRFVRRTVLQPTGFRELDEVQARARKGTPMADHLVRLFTETLVRRPRLIVELGVGPGESTFVLERVARLTGASHVSVDIEDRAGACQAPGWLFVQADDVEFARRFEAWCRARRLPTRIDVLFIDTSHYYEHTLREIAAYFPLLQPNGLAIFHDTNMRSLYFRKNGRMELGWDNQRGVIRALEEHFGKHFDERRAFVDWADGFLIRHYPYCNGFTILERVGAKRGESGPEAD